MKRRRNSNPNQQAGTPALPALSVHFDSDGTTKGIREIATLHNCTKAVREFGFMGRVECVLQSVNR
jgi:hypothetical protein